MATTEQSFTGNGSTTNYSFTFPYLKSTDITVQLDNAATTNWSLANATTVQFTAPSGGATTTQEAGGAPKTGVKIKILRKTNVDNLTATFYAGSAIKSEDLNDNYTQNLYVTQEIGNRSFENTGLSTMIGDLQMGEDTTIKFEGATDDAYETTLTVTDPTADRTITLPNVTGTVVTTGDTATVTATMMADNSVGAAELSNDAVDIHAIQNNAVTTAKIADNAVVGNKIHGDAIDGSKIQDNAIDSEHYAADSIDTEHYAPNSVDTAAIAANAVTASELADDAVDTDAIVNLNVTTAKIAADAIVNSKLADDAVQTENISNGHVTAGKLATDAVETAKIKDLNVTRGKLEADIIDSTKIANDAVQTEHIANGHVTAGKLAADCIDSTKIADNAVDSEHYVDGSIDNEHLADDAVGAAELAADAVVNASVAAGAAIAHSKLANVTDGSILVGNGSNVPTSVAISGDVTLANTGAVTIASNAVEIGMIGCEQTTISDSDSHIPTSGAVVDYVAAQLAPIGGLEVIADDESFPNTIPAAGVVISISDAAGLSVNSSGVSTNGDTLDNSTVTINGFPSELRGGVGSNADPYVFQSGAGLMVQSTGSSQTYNYHQVMIRESDFVQLSDDINDFNNRYRINAGEPSSNNDDGDLVWDTNADKMKVYDGTASAWKEVTSSGDFKYLFLCPAGGTGAPTINGSIATYDLREGSNSGSAASVTSAAQLIVSVDGVIQKANTGTSAPAEGFALVDSNTIVFGANLASGSSVFIVQSGSAISIPTPGDNTVTAAKIANGAVVAAGIGTGAVETAKLAADAVDGTKIADNAVDSEHYTDGSIDNEHLADNAVDLAEMAHGTQGDVLYYGSGGAPTRLGAGTSGYYLKTQGGSANPVWAEVTQGVTSDAQNNTVAGTSAGASFSGTDANENTLYGKSAGAAITTGDRNVAIGMNAGDSINTGSWNIAVGRSAGAAITSGARNIAIGDDALVSLVDNNDNVAVGFQANYSTTGIDNTAVGNNSNNRSTGSYNTAVGYKALEGGAGADAAQNVAVGTSALKSITSGDKNVAVGKNAGTDLTGAMECTFVGYQAGDKVTTGNYNTLIGKDAGTKITSSSNNVAVGCYALDAVTDSGSGNVAVGYNSMGAATEATNCVAIGENCYTTATTGDHNIAIGFEAIKNGNTTGARNIAIGKDAGDDLTSGNQNTCVGGKTGTSLTEGSNNTLIGYDCGYNLTTGSQAVCIGYRAGQNQITTTGDSLWIAKGANGAGNGNVWVHGTDNGNCYQGDNSSSWSTNSDERLKKNIVNNNVGLSVIDNLQVRNFEYRTEDEIDRSQFPKVSTDKYTQEEEDEGFGTKGEYKQGLALGHPGTKIGIIAQELEAVVPSSVTLNPLTGVKTVDTDEIFWHMLNAIKELSTKVKALEAA